MMKGETVVVLEMKIINKQKKMIENLKRLGALIIIDTYSLFLPSDKK